MTMDSYTWVIVLATIFAFFASFGIGANDVANAFATSVGAKSLTYRQAIIVAAIFEFCGVIFMGKHVTDTVRKGITDTDFFVDKPEILLFGMMTVCFSVAFWLLLATYLKLPVSTTHTCIGSILGMAVAAEGWEAVNWPKVTAVIISWFASPFLSGVFALSSFLIIRVCILRKENSVDRTVWFYPFLIGFTVLVITFYTIYKGTPQLGFEDTPFWLAALISLAVASGVGTFSYFLVVPWMIKRIVNTEDKIDFDHNDVELQGKETNPQASVEKPNGEPTEKESNSKAVNVEDVELDEGVEKKKSGYELFPDLDVRFHQEASEKVIAMHDSAEQFDPKAERMFSYLQIVTACSGAFAHGANDVANSIGPFAAVMSIYNSGNVAEEADIPFWILVFGGVGILLGLAIYGYKIMQAIGFELTKMTPSRGFCVELASSMVVITGSRFQIPLSTTHCQVGACVGMGLSEGFHNVNWRLMGKVVAGWVMTLVAAALVTAGFFSFAIYSPKV